MPSLTAPQFQFSSGVPDRLIMVVPDLDAVSAKYLAIEAVHIARMRMPRVTGATANRLVPVSDEKWFGIYFPDSYTWFMEHGSQPFTMRSLAGKTIPMWITDTDGSVRRKNPKAKVRTTLDGRIQVQIFRRAARIGQKKMVTRPSKFGGAPLTYAVPASYPGAPGRINRRESPYGWTESGHQANAIAQGNTGVKWRHPGLRAMQFLNSAIAQAAFESGLMIDTVYAVDGASWESLLDRK
jgi:hypothetical protein